MLTIRLQRVGRKHEPVFRVVVTDTRTAAKKNRRFHEIVGSYDPRDRNETRLNSERIKHWIGLGVKPTGTVHNLLITKNIIDGKKVNVLPSRNPIRPKKEGEEEKAAPAVAAAVDTPADDVAAPESPEAEVVEVVEVTTTPEEATTPKEETA